jgi:hypothetical protein
MGLIQFELKFQLQPLPSPIVALFGRCEGICLRISRFNLSVAIGLANPNKNYVFHESLIIVILVWFQLVSVGFSLFLS